MELTNMWQTIETHGYTHPVSRIGDRRADGGVCHIQRKINNGGQVVERKILANGRYRDIGPTYRVVQQ